MAYSYSQPVEFPTEGGAAQVTFSASCSSEIKINSYPNWITMSELDVTYNEDGTQTGTFIMTVEPNDDGHEPPEQVVLSINEDVCTTKAILVSQKPLGCTCGNLIVTKILDSIPHTGLAVGIPIVQVGTDNDCRLSDYTSSMVCVDDGHTYETEFKQVDGVWSVVLKTEAIPSLDTGMKDFNILFFYKGTPCTEKTYPITQESVPCTCESINIFVRVGTYTYFPLRGTSYTEEGEVKYELVTVGSGTTAVEKDGKILKVCGELLAQSSEIVFKSLEPGEEIRVVPDQENKIMIVPVPLTQEEIDSGLDPNKPYKFLFKARILSGNTVARGAIDLYFRNYDGVEISKCEGSFIYVERKEGACDCANKQSMTKASSYDGFVASGVFPCAGLTHAQGSRIRLGYINVNSYTQDFMTYGAKLITDIDYVVYEHGSSSKDFLVIYYNEDKTSAYVNYYSYTNIPVTINDGIATFTIPYTHEEPVSCPIKHVENGIPSSGFSYTMTTESQYPNKRGLNVYGDLPYQNTTGEERVVGMIRVFYYCGHGAESPILSECGYLDYVYTQEKCETCDCEYLNSKLWGYNEETERYEYKDQINFCNDKVDVQLLYGTNLDGCLEINNVDLGQYEDIYDVSSYYYYDTHWNYYNAYLHIGLKEGVQRADRQATIDFEIGYKDGDTFVKCGDARLELTEVICNCNKYENIPQDDINLTISCSCSDKKKFAEEDGTGMFSLCDVSCIKFYISLPGSDDKHTGYSDWCYYKNSNNKNLFYAFVDYDYNDYWYVQACQAAWVSDSDWDDFPSTGVTLEIGAYIGDLGTVGTVCSEAPKIKVIVKKDECVTCTCDDFLNNLGKGDNVSWNSSKTEITFIHYNGEESMVEIKPFKGAPCGYANVIFTDESGTEIAKPSYVHNVNSSGQYENAIIQVDRYETMTEPRVTYIKARSSKTFDGQNCEKQFKLLEYYQFDCDNVPCTDYAPNPPFTVDGSQDEYGRWIIYTNPGDPGSVVHSSGSKSHFITFINPPSCFNVNVVSNTPDQMITLSRSSDSDYVYFDLTWNNIDKDNYVLNYSITIDGRSSDCDEGPINIKFELNNQ